MPKRVKETKKVNKSEDFDEIPDEYDDFWAVERSSKFSITKTNDLSDDSHNDRSIKSKNKRKGTASSRSKCWGWTGDSFRNSTKAGAVPNVRMYKSIKPKSIGVDLSILPKAYTEAGFTERSERASINDVVQEGGNIVEVGIVPLDGNDPLIYSKKVAVSPYSFLDDNTPYNKKAPPP